MSSQHEIALIYEFYAHRLRALNLLGGINLFGGGSLGGTLLGGLFVGLPGNGMVLLG